MITSNSPHRARPARPAFSAAVFLPLITIFSLLLTHSASAESCRAELFADAAQTHSNDGLTSFGFNAVLLNNPDSILQTPAVQGNGGSTASSCGQDDCSASGAGVDSLVLDTFEIGQSGQNVQVNYQGSSTLGGDGVRSFGSVNISSVSYTHLTLPTKA